MRCCIMTAMTSRYRILETNVLLERFVTYNEVFSEYLKTIKIIERGEALRYETYGRLIDNYIRNVKQFIQLCNSYLAKYKLENSLVAEKLNNYFLDLIGAISCMDPESETVDHGSLALAQSRIKKRQTEFVDSINFFIK